MVLPLLKWIYAVSPMVSDTAIVPKRSTQAPRTVHLCPEGIDGWAPEAMSMSVLSWKNVRYNLDVIHWGYSWIYWGYSWIYSCIVKNCWIYWGLKKQRYSPIQHNCWMYITNDRFGWIAMNYQPEKPHAERHPGEKIVAWIRHDGRIAMMPCTFSMLPSPKTLHHRCGLLLDEN
jgi:hypothetical protein